MRVVQSSVKSQSRGSGFQCESKGIAGYEFLTNELVADILYADRYFLRGKSAQEKRKIRDVWLKDYLRCEYDVPQKSTTDVLFFRSLVRSDYKELFRSVIDASGAEDYVVFEDYKRRSNTLNVEASRHLVEAWRLISLIEVDDPVERVCCLIRLCMYTFILERLRNINFKVLVCFADMQPVEHLAAYYFRFRGLDTVTLQHGLYVDYGSMETVNVINYLHQPSQYFLAWGNCTASLIRNYHPDTEIHICGKPMVFTGQAPRAGSPGNPKCVTVFLDQKIFDQQNERMLNIVLSYCRARSILVRVRFHPSLNKAAYFNKYSDIVEEVYFLDSEFVVGHTSSLIYEAIALGCRAYRYQTEIPAVPLPDDYCFADEQGLTDCLRRPFASDLTQNYIAALNQDSRSLYKRFFEKLFESKGCSYQAAPS